MAEEAIRGSNGESQHVPPEYEQIRSLAYALWKARGCPCGSPEVDWLRAEQKLREGSTDKIFDFV
jgi:hypothetical protein